MHKYLGMTLAAGVLAGLLFGMSFFFSGRAVAAPLPAISPTGTPPARPTASVTRTPPALPAGAPTGQAPASPTARPYTGHPPGPAPTIVFTATALSNLSGIWLGQLTHGANIRSGPGTSFAVNRSWAAGRRVLVYGQALAANGETWYQVGHYPEPDLYIWSGYVKFVAPLQVAAAKHPGRWVDVNLTQQTLIAFDGGQPVMLVQISSGRKGHETTVGSWRIYWRLEKQDMDGGDDTPGNRYYNLKDVPWIQYFQQSGEALHGAYWHDNFGTPMSHGCVNLSDQNALWLYRWAALGTFVEVHY
jgi:hypothetical protein